MEIFNIYIFKSGDESIQCAVKAQSVEMAILLANAELVKSNKLFHTGEIDDNGFIEDFKFNQSFLGTTNANINEEGVILFMDAYSF